MSQATAQSRVLAALKNAAKGLTAYQIQQIEPGHNFVFAEALCQLTATSRVYRHPITERYVLSAIA